MSRALIALFAVGCIQAAKLPGEYQALQSQIQETARDKWAQECAPVETARAITHAEFADLEFRQGDARRATEHLEIARENAASAITKADLCRPKDRDKDAIFDHIDKCPDEPEDYDDHFRFCGTPQFETHLLWMAGGRLPLRFKRLAALGVNTQHHYTGCKRVTTRRLAGSL